MSDKADGSLVINTELDNEGFEKGSDKLMASIESLASKIDAFGGDMRQAFSGITSTLHALSAAINGTATNTDDNVRSATRAVDAAEQAAQAQADAAEQAAQAQADAAEQAARAQAQAGKRAAQGQTVAADAASVVAAATKQFDKELVRLQKQITSAEKGLAAYHQEIQEVNQSTNDWMAQVNGSNAAEQITNILAIEAVQIEKINEKYADKIAVLRSLQAEYSRVAKARDAAAQAAAAQAQAQAQADATAASSVQVMCQELGRLKDRITAVRSELDGYQKKVQAVQQATNAKMAAVTDGPDTERQINELLAEEAQQLGVLQQNYIDNLKVLGQLTDEHRRIAAAILEQKMAQEQASGMSGIIQALSAAISENVTDEKALAAAAGRVVDVFGSMGKKIGGATKMLLKMPFTVIVKSTKLAAAGLRAFSKQVEKSGLSSDKLVKSLTSLKTMLVSRVKRMFISLIFKNVSDALKSLALFNERFNEQMSRMKNSLTQLNGNIAVTVGNLLSMLEPVIMSIIKMFNGAVTSINQFFAVLGGKNTYTAAVMGAEKFAEATDKAAGAQKKLNAELYSFDELNRQSDPDASKKGADTTIQFEELPINLPAEVQKWINDLKTAWSQADWGGVGEALAEGLNTSAKIADDWFNNVLRSKGKAWATRAAEILNGVFDKTDWASVGKTVADGFNAVADTVNTFFTTFKAKNFGNSIGMTVKGWFDGIDWSLIGQTFANGWNTLLHTVEGIVTTPGLWTSIGTRIGEFIRSWFTNIDLNSIATSLIAAFNGVTALINSFLDQNPFEGVAEKIFGAINRVLHEVNWAELGAAICRLFMTVLKNLVTVVQQIDWTQLGYAVGKALSNVNWGEVFSYAAQFIGAALKAMFEFLGGMIKGDGLGILVAGFSILAGSLATKLAGALFKGVLSNALTSVVAELLKGVIGSAGVGGWGTAILGTGKALLGTIVGKIGGIFTTVLPAILATLGKIVTGIVSAIGGWPVVIIAAAAAVITALVIWIKNGGGEVIQGFIDGVKEKWEAVKQALRDFADLWITGFRSLFGIHSPSRVMAEQGGYLMSGLLQGISQGWSSVIDFLSRGASELFQSLSGKWQEMASNAKEKWSSLKSNVTEAFENARATIADIATQIGGNLRTRWSEICSTAQTAWTDLKTAVSNAIIATRSSAQGGANGMRSDLNSTFSAIVTNAQTAWTNLQTVTKNRFTNLYTNVLNIWQNLRSNLNSVKWDNVGHNLVAGLNNGIVGAWGGLMTNVSNMVNNLIARVKALFGVRSPSRVFLKIGEYLDAGLSLGLENGERGLLTTAKNIAAAVTNGMTPDTPHVQMSVDSVIGSMQAIISSLGSLATTFQTIASALTSIGGFSLPDIAAGTVAPYQTRVAANAAPAGAEGGVEAYLLGILSELQALSRSMQSGDDRKSGDVRVIIGGREVFQVVVDENNRAVRTTGKSPLKVGN